MIEVRAKQREALMNCDKNPLKALAPTSFEGPAGPRTASCRFRGLQLHLGTRRLRVLIECRTLKK